MEYVDVRGTWPVYIKGLKAITLVGAKRDIDVVTARVLIRNGFFGDEHIIPDVLDDTSN